VNLSRDTLQLAGIIPKFSSYNLKIPMPIHERIKVKFGVDVLIWSDLLR